MIQDPFRSIKENIHLPRKYKISQNHLPFQPLGQESEGVLYEQLLNKTNGLVSQLNQLFQNYQNPTNFHFQFPQSLFPNVPPGEVNQITYQQKIISQQEDTFHNQLSQEQIEDIAKNGQFKVRSNIQYVTLPYVWKINETLFWGRQKVSLVWKNSMAKIYGMLVQAKDNFVKYIPQEIIRLLKIPWLLFSILFGKKSLQVVILVDYEREIFKDFWKMIMSEYYKESEQWGSALWNYLYVYYDPWIQRPLQYGLGRKEVAEQYQALSAKVKKNKDRINQVHNEFAKEWNKLKKKILAQISSNVANFNNNSIQIKNQLQEQFLVKPQLNNDNKILQALAQRKFTLYTDYMRQQLPKKDIPLDVVNALLIVIRLFKVIHLKYESTRKVLLSKRNQISESIRKRHPIKHRYLPFFNSLFEEQYQIVSKAVTQEMYQQLFQDKELNSLLNQNQREALRQFIKLRSNYNALQAAKKKQLRELHSPTRTFIYNYPLSPPYKIINKNGYSLKKVSNDEKVSTKYYFWKVILYCVRLKIWFIKSAISLLYFAWKGPTGIRCLFGIQNFMYDMNINAQTGQITNIQRKTVLGTFLKVMDGIKKSREQFQEVPDRGLLGKNVSRLCNYIQCYIFRLIFVGIIFVLIGYPCLIIVLSTFTMLLVLTIWIWIPIAVLVTYFFNILIYQLDYDTEPIRCWIPLLPILGLVYSIIKAIILIIVFTVNLLIFAPLKTLLIFLFCCLQRCFRAFFDRFLLFLFRRLGRTPSNDSSIAKKISGPGMSKQFYMSINEEDVYVLIRSQLQQIYMRKFNQLVLEEISSNDKNATKILQTIFKPFKYINNGLQQIKQNTYQLRQNYNHQFTRYMARYPKNPSMVRFTQQEIDNYFDNTVKIVKNFVLKYHIQKWIFEQYVLYEGMYEQLTRSIWIEIFNVGEQIFEPLQQLDVRFKLEDQYNNEDGFNLSMKNKVRAVMKSLEGQVSLHQQRQHLSPFKHNLLHQQSQVDFLDNIWLNQSKNSARSVWLNLQQCQTAFVPNLNIKQIFIIDEESRQRNIKRHEDIVDL